MLVVLFLMAAFHTAAPAPGLPPDHNLNPPIPLTILGRELPSCINPVSCRDLQDIIWSCLATIFACAWVAVHPNVPSSRDSEWNKVNKRLLIMVYAMLVPEFITMWALRQRIGAGKHVEEYNEKFYPGYPPLDDSIFSTVKSWFRSPEQKPDGRWTMTHGFLLEMRGLVLGPDDILEEVGHIPASFNITEDEINDKSKGDFLTKALVVLQTTWFIVQCLVRWITHLPVTELEVITLAFAFLNLVTYVLWWKKPQNMGIAIAVHRYVTPTDLLEVGEAKKSDVFFDVVRSETEEGAQKEGETILRTGFFGRGVRNLRKLLTKVVGRLHLRKLTDIRLDKAVEFVMAPIHPLMAMLSGNDGDSHMFYSSQNGMVGWEMFVPICLIGMAFGGLHLMPLWLSSFPSSRDEHLWKLSAIWITIEPAILLCSRLFGELPLDDIGEMWVFLFTSFVYFIGIVGSLLLYVIARLILFVLAFTTLRQLPPDTYRDIGWSSFLPHF